MTDTFNPTTQNGFAETVNATWSTAHDAATSDTVDASNDGKMGAWQLSAGGSYVIERAYFPIDTSSIPDTATIISASLFFYSRTTGRDAGNHSIYLVHCNDLGVLDTADYNDIGDAVTNPTTGGSLNPTSMTGWQEIVLNSTGLGWINKTGSTFLGTRADLDCNNTTPVFGVDELFLWFNNVDNASNKPYLSVTYSAGVGRTTITTRTIISGSRTGITSRGNITTRTNIN